jgi:DhnA family fructose-bisphosphate aldolase class Ia
MSRSAEPRLNRVLGEDGRCVVGLFDYGAFGEPAWVSTRSLVDHLVTDPRNAVFDAMNLPPGSAEILGRVKGRGRPTLIMRVDWSDFWLGGWFGNPEKAMPAAGATSAAWTGGVECALRLDAAAVLVSILRSPTHPRLYAESVRVAESVVTACCSYGLPVLVETAAFREERGGLVGDFDVESQATLAWQAAELGACLIKTDPTDDPADFAEVVAAAAGTPVLAGSGPAADEEQILARTSALIGAGAKGVAYGGNFARAADPFAMAAEISARVHGQPEEEDV